jgi:hypothetical protein
VDAGATALSTQPPEESCEFRWDGIGFSTAYFDRRANGTIALEDDGQTGRFPPTHSVRRPDCSTESRFRR